MTSAADVAAGALRRLDPEVAHRLTLAALRSGLGPRAAADDPILACDLAGLALSNPIGLAAGFDKDAVAIGGLARAGFGFLECGTTTPRPQAGNPKPRLFRLDADGAVINRMGFNNAGHEAFAHALERRSGAAKRMAVGANVGANKDSEDRVGDYELGLKRFWSLADYFTLNVSSPNTPGLRGLQEGDALEEMLARTSAVRAILAKGGPQRPVLLKIAPDLDDRAVEAITEAAVRHHLTGLIISNTTVERPESLRSPQASESGGLSGAPLFARSTRLLALFAEAAAGRLILIGVGGVRSGADAYAKIRAGASAVQLYTALALGGPSLLGRIKQDLVAHLRSDGFTSLREAVGAQ